MKTYLNYSSIFKCLLSLLLIFQINTHSYNNKFLSFKEESFSKEYKDLVNFVKNNGGFISQKLSINENSPTNRYILANEEIKKDEILSFVPEKILISKLHKDINRRCIEAYGFEEEHDFECVVYFMTMDKYNSSSIFKPYYNFLPKLNKNDFIISLTKEEQEKYKRSGITEGIERFYHFYNMAFDPVEVRLQLFAKKKKISYEQILEDFFINFLLVGTRNFGRTGYIAEYSTMVPFMDLLNHSNKNNTYWYYDEFKEGFYLISVRDIKKNEEVTISYGKHSNYYLFRTYGFVIPGNEVNGRIYVKIGEKNVRLDLDFVDDTIFHIFDKYDYNLNNFNEVKNNVLEILYEEKKYYESLNPKRFVLKVIFKEYLDIVNVYIDKIKLVSLSYIKNYLK